MTTPMRETGTKVVATNRKARRNYDILDTIEAGLVLRGSEVKSIRDGKVQIGDAFARIDGSGEIWLHNLTIAVYAYAQEYSGHEETRKRKLLLHSHEIERLRARVDPEHLSLIPLSVYFKGPWAKLEVAVAKGRKKGDKREALKRREAERDIDRESRRMR